MEILWKGTASGKSAKTMRKRAFPQNFHTRKLGEITIFFAVFSDIVREHEKVKNVANVHITFAWMA